MRYVAAAIATALLLGGAVAARAQDDWQAGGGPAWQKLLAAARQEGKLVFAGTIKSGGPLQAGFKRDTGIDVDYLNVFGSDLFARASREYKSGQVTMDAVLMGANGVPLEGYMEPIAPKLVLPGATDPARWIDQKLKFIDTAGTYMFLSSESVASWVLIDKDIIKPGALAGWQDLLKPEYVGKIAIFDPHVAGVGANMAVFLAGTLGLDYVKKLYVDQHPKISRDSRQMVEWVGRGIYPIAIGVYTEDVEQFEKAGITDYAEVAMTDAPGLPLGGYALHLPRGAPHPNAAAVFANWFVSRPGQEIYDTAEHTPSRRTDVQVAGMPDYLVPKHSVDYVDGYDEKYLVAKRPTLQKAVMDLLDASN